MAPARFGGRAMTKKLSPKQPPDVPAELLKVEVLPGVLIDVVPVPEDMDVDAYKGIAWPELAASPPEVGDVIFSNCGRFTGRVMLRGFRVHGDLGPYIWLSVSIDAVEESE